MKILNFGSCNIDYVYSVDHIVKPGETIPSHAMETFAGGKGLNQSVAAARAGGAVYHGGMIGRDGLFLKQLLADSGVNLSYLAESSGISGHAIIQVTGEGQNSIVLYPGANHQLKEEYILEVLEDFEKQDIVVLQNEINLVDFIVEQAYRKGMKILLNPSPYNQKIKDIDLHKISYLILNEIEGEDMAGTHEPEEILSYFENHYPNLSVILTLGAKGSIYAYKGERLVQPSFSVPVVDTTAAGDTFTGYVVAGLARGEKMETVLKTASAAAALAVTRKGAAPSIPTMDEVATARNHW